MVSKSAIVGATFPRIELWLAVLLTLLCVPTGFSQTIDPTLVFIGIDYFEQPDLPLNVEAATLVKEESGKTRLKARVANRSDEMINGVSFALVSFDANGKIIGRLTWLEKIDLEAGELRPVTFHITRNVPFEKDGKLVLAVEEVFGARSIWLSEKVHNTIELYGAGKTWEAPTVKRVTNAVDSPP